MYYLIGFGYFILFFQFAFAFRSFLYVRRERGRKRSDHFPKVAIIAPHYGWDRQTEENVRRVLTQNYQGDHRVFLVTHKLGEDGFDQSFPHLQKMTADLPHAEVLLAPNIVDQNLPRSQKVQNLMTAIEHLDDDISVIAFVDADAEIQSDWLEKLIEPLHDAEIGATVGARFYVSETTNLATLIEATWINFQISMHGDHSLTMVWGGSNAIRRSLLTDGKVLERWHNAAIEDHNLTHAVRDLGQKIHFVPDSISISRMRDRTLRQIFKFTNRQIIMTYWMKHKAQWALALFTAFTKLSIWIASVPLAILSHKHYSLLWITPFLEIAFYRKTFFALSEKLRSDPKIQETINKSSFTMPLSTILIMINCVVAIFKNEIVWGGVRYQILSDTKCKVFGKIK